LKFDFGPNDKFTERVKICATEGYWWRSKVKIIKKFASGSNPFLLNIYSTRLLQQQLAKKVWVVAKKICMQARNRQKYFDKLKPKASPKPSWTQEIWPGLQLWDTAKIQLRAIQCSLKGG